MIKFEIKTSIAFCIVTAMSSKSLTSVTETLLLKKKKGKFKRPFNCLVSKLDLINLWENFYSLFKILVESSTANDYFLYWLISWL